MTRKNRRNYYRLLQVQPDAPIEVIRASYRTLMRTLKHHPDLGGDQWNAAFINEAYATLSDARSRERYDREQQGLKERSGAAARAAGAPTPASSHPRSTPDTDQPETARSAPPPGQRPANSRICAFCQTESSGRAQSPDELCNGCGGPRWPVHSIGADAYGRARQRIERQADIQYRVEARGRDAIRGRVVNLSPTGLRFLSPQQLTPGRVIKIDSPALSAIARVTRSRAADSSRSFSTGVQFLTLRLERPRGTFVSKHA